MRIHGGIFAGAAALALVAVAWAGVHASGQAQAQQATSVTVNLGAGRDGSQTGTATLTAQGDQTEVNVNIQPGAAGVGQPAHIHEGSCPVVGAVKYPLTSIVDGASTTMVAAKLADLQTGGLSINVHKSQAEVAVYVSCGGIPAAQSAPTSGGSTPPRLPTTGTGSSDGGGGIDLWLVVLGAGGVAALAGVAGLRGLRRRA